MNSRLILLVLSFLLTFTGHSQDWKTVFEGGKEGHANYRIPAIISLPNGDLVAFAEGRVNGSDDFGDVNLVMKNSHNGGHTWSPLQTLVDYDTLQAGNPAPVVDLMDPDYPEGVIFFTTPETIMNMRSESKKEYAKSG